MKWQFWGPLQALPVVPVSIRDRVKAISACWKKVTKRDQHFTFIPACQKFTFVPMFSSQCHSPYNLHIQIRLWSYVTCSVMMSFNQPKNLMKWQLPKLQYNYSCDKLYALVFIVHVVMLRMYEHVTWATDIIRDSPYTWLGNPCPSGHELHQPAVPSDLEQTTKYNEKTGNTQKKKHLKYQVSMWQYWTERVSAQTFPHTFSHPPLYLTAIWLNRTWLISANPARCKLFSIPKCIFYDIFSLFIILPKHATRFNSCCNKFLVCQCFLFPISLPFH